MIVDIQLFEQLGTGSSVKVLCRCDDCSKEALVLRYKLTQRNGYRTCQPCAVRRTAAARVGTKRSAEICAKISANGKGTRRKRLTQEERAAKRDRNYVQTVCRECAMESLRRSDQIRSWDGCCQSCRSKEVALRPESKERMRAAGHRSMPNGPTHPSWKGGITPPEKALRDLPEAKAWRQAVFLRDAFTCQICAQIGGVLNADHIEPFSLYPELRFELSNGRTLCKSCHDAFGARVVRGKLVRPAKGLK